MSTDGKNADAGSTVAGSDPSSASTLAPAPAPAPATSTADSGKPGKEKSAAPKPPPPASRPRGRGPGLLVGVLALIVALAALAAAWFAWQDASAARQALDETRQTFEETRSALDARLDAFPPALARTEARLDQLAPALESGLRQELAAFDERLGALHELLRRTATPTHEPADIENLLLIANDSLTLQRDVATALAALQTADERLRALADPAFAETRRRLAQEITTLRAAPRPDIAGTAFAISGVQQQLEALTLASLRAPGGEGRAADPAGAHGEQTSDDAETARWRAVLDDLWTQLRSLVVIRRSDEADGPLIAPDQRVFLNQNLHLRLESARLALLSLDAESFRHHIGIARDWLAHYYDERDAQVAALLARLGELARVDIAFVAPDISGSLKALREALERRRAPLLDGADAAASGRDS